MKIEIELTEDVVGAVGKEEDEIKTRVLEAYLSQLYRQRTIGMGHIQRATGYAAIEADNMLIAHGVIRALMVDDDTPTH